MSDPRILIALDYDQPAAALALADRLDSRSCRLKVGKELFTCGGPQLVKGLHDRGFELFLDLKFHDIPNTVAQAVRAAADLGVWMVNVHASGGSRMLSAARDALRGYGAQRPKLIAVTVLTSMSDADLAELGISHGVTAQVARLARLSHECGLDGVVCSAREAAQMKADLGAAFLTVTPGIRPSGAATDDQHRTMTPAAAVAAGSDYLVIGRPITKAADPLAALAAINAEIADVSYRPQ